MWLIFCSRLIRFILRWKISRLVICRFGRRRRLRFLLRLPFGKDLGNKLFLWLLLGLFLSCCRRWPSWRCWLSFGRQVFFSVEFRIDVQDNGKLVNTLLHQVLPLEFIKFLFGNNLLLLILALIVS